jgi:hypothetical protein
MPLINASELHVVVMLRKRRRLQNVRSTASAKTGEAGSYSGCGFVVDLSILATDDKWDLSATTPGLGPPVDNNLAQQSPTTFFLR